MTSHTRSPGRKGVQIQNTVHKQISDGVTPITHIDDVTLNGAPGVTRTRGTQIRNLVLYPPELRGPNPNFVL